MQPSFKDRLLDLAGHGALSIFADAAGIHPTNLSKQIARGAVDQTFVAHLEWLEETPVAKWPDRWAALRDRAKAHQKRKVKAA